MIRCYNVVSLGVFALVVSFTSSVAAKEPKKEEQWAQCLWETVPQSSVNWLAIPETKTESGETNKSPGQLLEYRLRAACYDRLKPPGKKFPVGFSSAKVRSALEASRPTSISQDTIDPKAFQCQRFFTNDTEMKNPAAYKWGFGDFDNGPAFASISYVYAAQGGGGVGLPEAGGLYKCQWINSDGSLTDA